MFYLSRYHHHNHHYAESLLGYPLRRAAASELLYGGVRVQYLVQKPTPLHKIKSEELPSPNLQRERHDLELEMSLPKDLHNYNNIHYNIERYVNRGDLVESEVQGEARRQRGFNLSTIFGEVDHPELMHNSSARTYSNLETRNILGYRVFPINIGSQWRGECIRIRTEDCLRRLQHAKLCALHSLPLQFPLSLRRENLLDIQWRAMIRKDNTLYEIDPNDPHRPIGLTSTSTKQKESMEDKAEGTTHNTNVYEEKSLNNSNHHHNFNMKNMSYEHAYAYVHKGPFHPHPSKLSIFTRPADQAWETQSQLNKSKCDESTDCTTNTLTHGISECTSTNGITTSNKIKPTIVKEDVHSIANKVKEREEENNHYSNSRIAEDALVESLFSRAMIQSWMPLQMLKPKGNTYSPTLRGSGVRAPNTSLYQERLNRRGFGWKKKARSLWQQDINTHGFEPERHY